MLQTAIFHQMKSDCCATRLSVTCAFDVRLHSSLHSTRIYQTIMKDCSNQIDPNVERLRANDIILKSPCVFAFRLPRESSDFEKLCCGGCRICDPLRS